MAIAHIKNIFVPFQPVAEEAVSTAVGYAMSLAEKVDGHLTIRALAVKVAPPYSFAPRFVGSLVGPINDQHKAELDKAHAELERRVAKSGIRNDTSAKLLAQQDILDTVGFHGRLHDISIVDLPYDYFTAGRATVEELLFHTGRPVIVVPKDVGAFSARRIVVAWDGGAQSSRALGDAMPLLRAAEHVELVSVVNEKDISKLPPGAELAPHLERHGIKTEVVGLDMIEDAGKTILNRAELVAADLIVMGAFAHARWRQFVLGGVTETILLNAKIPVFMSH